MEESFSSKVVHAVVFIAICAVILSLGWNEPLQFRFLSPQEIHAIENPATPAPAPTPTPWIAAERKGTRLDEAPRYKAGDGGSIYSLPYRKASGLEPPPDRKSSR